MLKKILIIISSIFFLFCKTSTFRVKEKKIIVDKIHWNQYAIIIKIPRYKQKEFLSIMKEKVKKNSIHLVSENSSFVLYRIPADLIYKLKQHFFYWKEVRNFPFIWWDYTLPERKNSNSFYDFLYGYKDYQLIQTIFDHLIRKYPSYLRKITIGKSYRNREIFVIHLTNQNIKNPYKIPIYINSLHHGNEILTVEYVIDMVLLLLGEKSHSIPVLWKNQEKNQLISRIPEIIRKQILDNLDIYIIPVVNPDGLEAFWYRSIYEGRKNARGVDLNRNYPFYWKSGVYYASDSNPDSYKFRGYYQASEREVQIIMKFLKKNPCVFGISYHTFANQVLFPYTIDHVWNPIPDRAYYFGKKIVQKGISFRLQNYRLTRKLYSVDGTDQDWIFNQTGCMQFLVEGSMNTPSFDVAQLSIIGMRGIWFELLQIAWKEPRIELEFYYGNKRVQPRIRIHNVFYFENENLSYFYRGRWIYYMGKMKNLELEIRYHHSLRNLKIHCENICREKIYLTEE